MSTNPARRQIVAGLCSKFPAATSRAITRMLMKDHGHLFPNANACANAVRYARGNRGVESRKVKSDIHRPNGACGFTWQFPRSSAPGYTPFMLDTERTLILSDLHIPFHSTSAIMAAVAYAKRRNPTCILLNGDVCDFFSLSRFEKNPKESSLKRELDLTRQFLGWLRQEFPKARIIYKLGNHDEWFEKYLLQKAPEFFGVAGISLQHLTTGRMDKPERIEVGGIEWIEDQQKIKAGKLNIWHGHEIGKGSIAPPVNPARGLFMRTLDCGLMGHLHKGSNHEETTSNGKLVATWSTGCLCGLWPRYARVNKWSHGAAFLELYASGNFTVTPIRILDGKVL